MTRPQVAKVLAGFPRVFSYNIEANENHGGLAGNAGLSQQHQSGCGFP